VTWRLSHRASPAACAMADRHYSRQKVGSPQFVPPGRCIVLIQDDALWTTSWPFAEYVKHDWAGAWMNTMFRNEGGQRASDLIREAIAATRFMWDPPAIGLVTFVDPKSVPGTPVRGERIYGHIYARAGFRHVGFTKGGLWAWQLLPEDMPAAAPALGMQERLLA
jgi:hypothetical protein